MLQALYYVETPIFSLLSVEHLALLTLIFSLAGLLVVRPHVTFRYELFIRTSLIITIVVQQFLLYSWYIAHHAFDPVDAFPLYPCRITTLFVLFLLIKWNTKLFHFTFYWGIVGAFLALLSPDTSGLGFPNVMFIQFFLGHAALLIGTVFLAVIHDYKPNQVHLFKTYQYSAIYFLSILFINEWLGSNYAYLRTPPPTPFLSGIPAYPYHVPLLVIVMFSLFAIVNFLYKMSQKAYDACHEMRFRFKN